MKIFKVFKTFIIFWIFHFFIFSIGIHYFFFRKKNAIILVLPIEDFCLQPELSSPPFQNPAGRSLLSVTYIHTYTAAEVVAGRYFPFLILDFRILFYLMYPKLETRISVLRTLDFVTLRGPPPPGF